LSFTDDGGAIHSFSLKLYLAEPPHNQEFESLLGRDALAHFVMHFDQRGRTVSLTAR
jgi:hypothetical protein